MKKEVDEIYVQVLTRLSITAHSQLVLLITTVFSLLYA